MRLWSLHPRHLDSKGLVALWREGLLAKAVLENKTIGYKNHPQLNRFKATTNPVETINEYLYHVYVESLARGYNFDKTKISHICAGNKISVSNKQIQFEVEILNKKLLERKQNYLINDYECHPCVETFNGPVADWEFAKIINKSK